jgi:heme oxygenase
MLLRVALETRVHHNIADADRLAVMDARDRSTYRTFLERVHGFESSVETAIVRAPDLDAALVRSMMKTARLRQDLTALGLELDEIDQLPAATAPNIRTAAQALGWMFVLERHTLLSGLIRRHLSRYLAREMAIASAYLSAYGDTPGARFRIFGDALGDYGRRYAPDFIVAAAREAFRAQRQWYMAAGEPRPTADGSAIDAATPSRHYGGR